MAVQQEQLRKTLRTTAYNNAATAELLRRIARLVPESWAALELKCAADRLDADADALEGVVVAVSARPD